ncbi:hypothetical protein NLG97_g5839 [Lecanicillium saksenae]|uniref:Uncharacterized protein n=1 Tax=Lecanicillium saksenae TaxID=468837 RepID=A0ACC1QT77_9HYPO|nr:hypothetical protein NLG97_g5839 [Lecanicillium saksenae]
MATAVTLTGPKLLRGKIRLFTEDRPPFPSSSRRDVIGRPPLSGLACESTISLLQRWVAACKERHVKCCETLSGDTIDDMRPAKILPNRVLCLSEGRVRIVQSGQRCGPYVALSHCWGPEDKRPIRSIKSNIQDFEKDVPWDLLPKSYQDAITIVRALDIQYIWIDSLCIVQDDHDDWLRESALMGSVYERAEFTIAASHASNSTEGFLSLRPNPSPAVLLPNFLSNDPTSPVLARLRHDSATDTFPENGALNTRSWATQEWLLSRRMLFFTPANVMWSCKTLTQRETGERCFNISRNTRWKTVVEAYSERRLTYPTDRLTALDGLRTELQKKGDTQRYLSGIWEDKLPDQLLWQVAHELLDAPNPLGLPSWTWARVSCGVRFLLMNKAKNVCHRIAVSECGREIGIRARVRRLSNVTYNVNMNGSVDAIMRHITADINASHAKATSSLAKYILARDKTVGWLVYDVQDAAQDGPDYAIAVMSTLSRREDDLERLHGSSVAAKKQHQYWCIIFRKTADGECHRVGVAKIYSQPHREILVRAIENVYNTDEARIAFAQVPDGVPTIPLLDDGHPSWSLPRSHPSWETHQTLCSGIMERLELFRRDFDIQTLQLDSQAMSGFQSASPGSRLFNTQLIELVSRSIHQIAVEIALLDESPNKEDDLLKFTPPESDTVFWRFSPDGPPPTWLHLLWYQDYKQYPNGQNDMIGYWAENYIIGGVLLFDRREDGGHSFSDLGGPVDKIYLDFLGADASTATSLSPLPLKADKSSLDRVDPEEPILETGIYRDAWERPPLSDDEPDDRLRDVFTQEDYPRFADYCDARERAQRRRERIDRALHGEEG